MKLIYFDVSALLIMVILLAVIIYKRMLRGDINRYFLLLLCLSIVTTMLDIWAVTLDNGSSGYPYSKYIAHSLYLVLHNAATPFFILYCTALTDSWFDGKHKYLVRGLMWLPLSAIVVLMCVNLRTPIIFYLDSTEKYTRGPWFPVLYFVAGFYVVYGLIKVLKSWHFFDIGRWVALFSGIAFMVVASILQFLIPEILVEMLAGALALLFILMMVQRPEELLDNETGLFTFTAFMNLMYHAEHKKRKKKLILINITNYKRIHMRVSYEQERAIAFGLADMLFEYTNNFHERAEIYHLHNGRFAVVLHADEPSIVVVSIAKQILEMMKKPFSVGTTEVEFRPSLCILQFPKDIADADALLHFIEDMGKGYRAEELFFARDVFKKERYDILLEIDEILDRAIRERRFKVYYQPIYSVEEQAFRTAEALVRLYDEKYGFIPPDLFIPAAERSGAILKIGQIVLEQVCEFIGSEEYRRLGLHYIEVNMSVVQCMEEGLVQDVIDTFDRYHISSRDVNLEITETAVSDEQQVMDKNINDLFSEGVCFSLDDFGTGYSNIHRIASLPFSLIKLDKSLVDNAGVQTMQIVIENTVKMIKALGMKIVVEGVETEQQLKQFISLRCDYIQGYYFSKPLPREEFVEFLMDKAG